MFNDFDVNSLYQEDRQEIAQEDHIDHERPQKRARLLDNDGLATKLVRKIYSLLNLDEATDLHGLDQMAMYGKSLHFLFGLVLINIGLPSPKRRTITNASYLK